MDLSLRRRGCASAWIIAVELEFDDMLSVSNGGEEGKVTRGLVGLKINAFLLPDPLKDRLILSADLAYRRDLQNDFNAPDPHYPFAQLSAAIALDPFKIFSIALDRVMGEDPTQDFDGLNFTRFSFKVQLTRPQKRSIARSRGAQHII